MLDFGKDVFRVAVEFEIAHFDQRVILVRPDLGQVERIDFVVMGLVFGHDLDVERPARKVTRFDAVEQIPMMTFPVAANQILRFLVAEVLHALLALEGELDPVPLVVGVDQAEGVAAETVHVPIAARNAALTHDDGHLMQGFGQ
ncbi:hypothetical protein D3C85_606110 [compost metagenome]